MFCVFCLTNTGFVQCYSLGSLKVCCTLKLVLYCALFSNFLFCVLCLTNIGFGQCFSFGPHKEDAFVTLRTLICVFCLKNTGFVQCYSLGSHQVFFACLSLFCFIQQFFALRVLPHQHRACAVLSLRLPSSLHPFGFLCFVQFASVMRALPDKLRFVQWFLLGSLRIQCTLYFLLYTIQF